MDSDHKFTQLSHTLEVMFFSLSHGLINPAYRVRNPYLKLQGNLLPNFHLMMLPRHWVGKLILGQQAENDSYQATHSQGFIRYWQQQNSQGQRRLGLGRTVMHEQNCFWCYFSSCFICFPILGYAPFLQYLDLSLAHLRCQVIMISGANQEDWRIKIKV